MSGAVSATTILAAAAVAGTAYSIYNGEQQRSAQNKAGDQAKRNAAAAADQADQANNRANAKTPNLGAMLSANQTANSGGVGSTMLTGPAGVDPNLLLLGKNTLLGQ